MKYFFSILVLLLCTSIFPLNVQAQDTEQLTEIYREQAEWSGTDRLFSALDEDTQDTLKDIGINEADAELLSKLDIEKIFSEIALLLANNSQTPLHCLGICIGIMLLCALVEGSSLTLQEKSQNTILSLVGTLALTSAVIIPICQTIGRVCEVIDGVSGFMLLYVPIMAGLMATAGQEVTGASYYGLMMTAGQTVSQISAKLIVPLLNIFLGMSITTVLSPRMNLKTFCDTAYKVAKWVLTFVTALFVTLLTVQSLVTSSMDSVTNKTLRFAISTFVPVVGGALGDALTTVSGSLKLLKSGAGVFAIVGASFMFLPVLLECFVWQVTLFCTAAAGDLFGLKSLSNLLKAVSKVISMMIGLLVCLMFVFVITTVIILLVGRT